MRKRLSLLASLLILAGAPQASGWGQLGHAATAKVAQDHLSPKAKKALAQYLGPDTIVSVASDADTYRDVWTLDLGFKPTNPEAARVAWLTGFDFSSPENIAPYSHSVTVDKDFVSLKSDNLNGAYVNNCAYYVERMARELKEGAQTMDPAERKRKISLIVHFLGDMHCPMHIVYLGRDEVKGGFKVTVRDKQYRYHSWWDGGVISMATPFSYGDIAALADTKSKKEIKEITKGDIYDWVHESAVDSWPAHNVKAGDSLDKAFPVEMRPILFNQIRNGGYRLAALLNDIFK